MLVDFSAGKTQLISFNRSNIYGAIDMKMDVSVLEEYTFKSWSYLPLLNWIGALIVKTVFEKAGALIRFMKFFSPEVAL